MEFVGGMQSTQQRGGIAQHISTPPLLGPHISSLRPYSRLSPPANITSHITITPVLAHRRPRRQQLASLPSDHATTTAVEDPELAAALNEVTRCPPCKPAVDALAPEFLADCTFTCVLTDT